MKIPLTKTAAITEAETHLYNMSEPVTPDVGEPLNQMFSSNGIARPPEVRAAQYLANGGGALTRRNAVVIDGFQSQLHSERISGIVAHEAGHIVQGDTGVMTRAKEWRADRFSHFMTGDPSGLAQHITESNEMLQMEFDALRKAGRLGKFAAWLKESRNTKMYGLAEDRLNNLQKPITEEEATSFREAIEEYNARMGVPNIAPAHETSAGTTKTTVVTAPQPPKTAPTPPVPESGTPPPPEVPAAEAAEASTALGRIGRVAGPVALVAPTVIEAGADGIKAYKDGKGAAGVAGATALGAGKGVVDTFAPGARSGYSDVIGHKHLTAVDRVLNAVDHASGTATAVGGAAMIGEAVGVVTLPAEIPTAIGTGIAGLTSVGTNLAKAGLKVTGLAGQDQDGGYIYDAIAWAAEKAKNLVSGGPSVPHGTAPHEVAKPTSSAVVQGRPQLDGRH